MAKAQDGGRTVGNGSAPAWRVRTVSALAGLAVGVLVLGVLPHASAGENALEAGVAGVRHLLPNANRTLPSVVTPVLGAVRRLATTAPSAGGSAPSPRAASPNPQTQPPLHGTQPHGQGSVGVVSLSPSNQRPFNGNPSGQGNGETLVVGRSVGSQNPDGSYHGHITVAALLGNEIIGVDTAPGQSKKGPLDAVQQGLLTPLCNGSANNICLSAVTADSATTSSGSANRFSTAHATLGGATGIDTGVAESTGSVSQTGACQGSHGDSQVANVKAGGTALASAASSSSDSQACQGQVPTQSNKSSVVGLGGTGVPIPAPGCANGAPNTQTGLPTLLPIICNANDSNGSQAGAPYGVRDALDVYALAAGTTSLLEASTGDSESRAVAPAAPASPCNVGGDNDCVTGTGPNGPRLPEGGTTDHTRDCSEGVENTTGCAKRKPGPRCNVGGDNDCVTGNGPTGPRLPEGGSTDHARDCSEGVENTTGCAGKPGARCNANGDNDCVTGQGPFGPRLSESGSTDRSRDCAEGVQDGGPTSCAAAVRTATNGTLPFTGVNVLEILMAGLCLAGAGLLLRTGADRKRGPGPVGGASR